MLVVEIHDVATVEVSIASTGQDEIGVAYASLILPNDKQIYVPSLWLSPQIGYEYITYNN